MKSFFKYILFLILLNVGLVAKSETIYPIQLYATMLPPYTNCISDYITDGMHRMKLTAVVRDMNNHSFNQVRVLIQVKMGNEIKCAATTYPAVLGQAKMMHDISVTALNNIIVGDGKEGGCLEEGSYEFVFQVFDAHNSSLPLSEPVSIYCYLDNPEPPVCIYPKDGDCIKDGGVINFTWMDAVASNLSSKEYKFELLEDITPEPSNSDLLPMFGDKDIAGKKGILERTIYNSNVYTLNYAGLLQTGRKYYWRVTNVTDASKANYTNGANKYSELSSFTFGDCNPATPEEVKKEVEELSEKLEIKSVDTDSKSVSATITWGLEGSDDVEALKKYCKYKLYFTRKKNSNESVDATASESNEENQESETDDNKSDEDSNVKSVDDITDEFVVEVGNVNTYTITSVERTQIYNVRVEGLTCDENKEISGKTDKSEPKDFMIPQLESEECNTNIKEVECQSLATLEKGASFFANDDNVVVKVTELDQSKSNDETHVYSGKGIVTCTIFKEKLGLNVEFKNIKVNKDNHLCDGVVEVVSSEENNLMVNLNDVAGKDRSASKALEQKEVKTAEKKEHVEDKKINLQYRDNIVTCDKTLYAVSNTGDAESVGTLTEGVTPSISSLDNENGVIEFDVEDGLKDNTCSPYIDRGAAPFQNKPIVDSYDRMGGSYIVPWLSMVAGDTKWIKAKPKKFNDNFKSKKQFLNLNFYARIAGKYYKLDSEMLKDTTYLVKVFGGEANKSYPIYAMSMDDSKTYGSANVYNMKYKEIKVKLVPVINKVQLDNSLTDFQNRLNKIFEPLGKKFIFNMDDKPFTDDDIKNPVDEHSKLDFLNVGLNTTEGNGIFANETKEMKLLRKLYQKNTSDDNSYDAYLFLIPKNTNYDIKGFMPRTYSVGYLFVGESGNSNAVQYNDIYTAAHELCHGVFGLQHTFDYLGVAQGVLGENLMDYSTADIFRYPSKYFQWYNIENPSDYHFPFVDTPEDGEVINSVVKLGMDVLSAVASEATDVYLLKEKDKMDVGNITKNTLKNFVTSGAKSPAGSFAISLLMEGIKCISGYDLSVEVSVVPLRIDCKPISVKPGDCNACSWCKKIISEGLGCLFSTIFDKATQDKLKKCSEGERKKLSKVIAGYFSRTLGLSYSTTDFCASVFSIMMSPPSTILGNTACEAMGFCSNGSKPNRPNPLPVPGIPGDDPQPVPPVIDDIPVPKPNASYYCKEDWWPKNGTLKKETSNKYSVHFTDVEYEEYTLDAIVENNKLVEISSIPRDISYVACDGSIHSQKLEANQIFDLFTKVCYDWLKEPGKRSYVGTETIYYEDGVFTKTVYPQYEFLSDYIDKNVLTLWETRNTTEKKDGYPNINQLYNGKKLAEVKSEIMGVEKGSKTLKVNFDNLQLFIDNAVSSYSGLETQLRAAVIATAHYLASVKSTAVSSENYIETSPYIYKGELNNLDSFDLNLYDNLLSEFLFKMERHIIEKDGEMSGSHLFYSFRYYDPLSEDHETGVNVYNAETLPNTFVNLRVR